MIRSPDWDIDREYGDNGEKTLRRILGLSENRIEVKRKRYCDDVFYVELEQSPHATGAYKPSGLATTKATYWAYAIADTGIFLLIPTARLRELAGT